jgi:hypothetical protein
MPHRSDEARWRDLESDAHLPEVQEIIREEIQNGAIRVRPKPGGGICIVPLHVPDNGEVGETEILPGQSQDEISPLRRAVRKRQVASMKRT